MAIFKETQVAKAQKQGIDLSVKEQEWEGRENSH